MNKDNILVVDDTPDNLRLLSTILTEQGYKVRKALNGQTALNTIRTVPPDLILLDINMPQMNGYQVCQQLKANAQTQAIPVIFISALDDVLDKVKAFQIGGVDYITKPFQNEEVLARVEHQLIIRRQHKQLESQNEQLQQEIRERQKAEDALRIYLHAVSHDLRNPVLGMSLVLKNLLKSHSSGEGETKIAITRTILERMESSCDRQLNLINSLIETQQYEVGGVLLKCQPLQLYYLTQQLAAEWEPILNKNQATLNNLVSPELPLVKADSNQLWRVYENLIANAIKHNPPGIKITLSAQVIEAGGKRDTRGHSEPSTADPAGTEFQQESGGAFRTFNLQPNSVCCTVADNGDGMNAEQAGGLFELYRRGKAARRTTGLGLGLYLCRQIIQAHGGKIGVTTNPGAGAKFWFTLPISDEERKKALMQKAKTNH